MSPRVFEETVERLFASKKRFSAFTGISQAQVQRYVSGASTIPKSVALLVLGMSMLERKGVSLPDLGELGVVVGLDELGVVYSLDARVADDPTFGIADRKRPGPKRRPI